MFAALTSTLSKKPVICPSTIVALSIRPTSVNNVAISATSILDNLMFAYFKSALSADK